MEFLQKSFDKNGPKYRIEKPDQNETFDIP